MTIEEKVKDWAFNRLSKVSEQFNNLPPCPYAKTAFVNDSVSFVEADYREFLDVVTKETLNFTGDKNVVIVYSKHNPFGLDYLEGSVEAMNFTLSHMKKDIWLLGFVNEWTMVLIQKITMLDDASIDLEKKGYYNNYNEDQFENYILKRRRLRNRL